ncbi:uncharacterized protein C17orf67 homolog [Opisthocomus hoazin]|uniref:uncharacterized protein C17orf67 homolog n=1 Tax=Opisthocomus hoazin TaxID=30419 RepID=UPI003F531718
MKQFLVFVFFLVLMTTFTDTSPILSEKDGKQIMRTRPEDRPRKAGFPDGANEGRPIGTDVCYY